MWIKGLVLIQKTPISHPGIVTLLKVVRGNITTLNSSGYNSHNGEEEKKTAGVKWNKMERAWKEHNTRQPNPHWNKAPSISPNNCLFSSGLSILKPTHLLVQGSLTQMSTGRWQKWINNREWERLVQAWEQKKSSSSRQLQECSPSVAMSSIFPRKPEIQFSV